MLRRRVDEYPNGEAYEVLFHGLQVATLMGLEPTTSYVTDRRSKKGEFVDQLHDMAKNVLILRDTRRIVITRFVSSSAH